MRDRRDRATAVNRAWWAYRLRLRRRRYLLRALRKGRELTPVSLRVDRAPKGAVRLFATLRNEAARLPHFLEHYRRLGVGHFLVIDNDSDDGTGAILAAQPDVSVWRTPASYKASRFGMDWINRLLLRHGAGHWCLTVDADELLVYPDCEARPLAELTAWLDRQGIPALSATMLELYPKGPVGAAPWQDGADPLEAIPWFDPWGYDWEWLGRYDNISIRGGPRRRAFFAERPDLAPHLHKTPLVRWRLPYVYLSSTHLALPRKLNRGFDARLNRPTGALLHTKFLPQVIDKSAEEKQRQEHFTHAERYGAYYDAVIADPDLWTPDSLRYDGPAQLEALGLISRGAWR